MHGLTLVPNWVGTALQAIRDRIQVRNRIVGRIDGLSRRHFRAFGLKRTRLGYMVNAYPGYGFAGAAKPEAGLVIAFVDIGSRDVAYSIQIESGAEATHRSNYAVDYRRDDATTAEEFVATHASKILRNHNVNVAAEDGRLVFRAVSESRMANDNIRVTTPQLERGAAAADRPAAHLQPASDRIDREPPDPEPSAQEKRPAKTADRGVAFDAAEEPPTSVIPIQQDRNIGRQSADFASVEPGQRTGNRETAKWDVAESKDLVVKGPLKAFPFTIDFDQEPLRFPSEPEIPGAAGKAGDEVSEDQSEIEEYGLPKGSIWNRNYLDMEEIEPHPAAGDEGDLPALVPTVGGEMGLEDDPLPDFDRPEHY